MAKGLKLTTAEAKEFLKENPRWFASATFSRPIIITDYCDLSESDIECLSPYVIFRGRNALGQCASFYNCQKIDKLEGQYSGSVNASKASFKEIGVLKISRADNQGYALRIRDCMDLKILTGKYPGTVYAAHCGIVATRNLEINADPNGMAANYEGCQNYRIVTGEYIGSVSCYQSGIEGVSEKVSITTTKDTYKMDLRHCLNLTHCPDEILNDSTTRIDVRTADQIGQQRALDLVSREKLRGDPTKKSLEI